MIVIIHLKWFHSIHIRNKLSTRVVLMLKQTIFWHLSIFHRIFLMRVFFLWGGGEDWGDRCTAICFLLCYKKIIVLSISVKLICVFFFQLPGPKTHKVSQKRISQNLSGKDSYSVPYSGEGIRGISRKSIILLPIQFIFMSDL